MSSVVENKKSLNFEPEWETTILGDVVDLLTGFPFKSDHYSSDTKDPRLVGGDNIAQGWLRWNKVRRWPRSRCTDIDDYWLKSGDVVLAMDRPWIEAGLKRAAIAKSDLPVLLIQRTARLRGTEKLASEFLRYIIGSRDFTNYITGIQTGSVVPHISPTQIKGYEFRLPPLPEQRRIAAVLGALDDKIELNRKMNQGLEAMAQALFKSWFVDYDPAIDNALRAGNPIPDDLQAKATRRSVVMARDSYEIPPYAKLFPDSFEDSELGSIPSGWTSSTLGDESSIISKGTTPSKSSVANAEDPSTILYLKVMNIANDGEIKLQTLSHIPRSVSEGTLRRSILRTGDVLFSIAGTIGRVAVVGTELHEANTNQAVAFIRPAPESVGKCFLELLLKTPGAQEFASSRIVQGVQANVSLQTLRELPFCRPGQLLLESFQKNVDAMNERILCNRTESRTLAALRDTLLPKLISGEVRVPACAVPGASE